MMNKLTILLLVCFSIRAADIPTNTPPTVAANLARLMPMLTSATTNYGAVGQAQIEAVRLGSSALPALIAEMNKTNYLSEKTGLNKPSDPRWVNRMRVASVIEEISGQDFGCKTSAHGWAPDYSFDAINKWWINKELEGDAVVKELDATIREHCPNAQIAVTNGMFTAKSGTMMFTLHGRSMTGEVFPQTFQQEGPNLRGFVLAVSLENGPYQGQAVTPQTLQGPYFPTFIDAPVTEDGQNHYWVTFSYGSRLDEKVRSAILAALPRTKFPENAANAMNSPVVTNDSPKAETNVHDLNPPKKITGLLGKPLGTRMVIDGVFAEHAIMLANPLAVTRIDGQPFKAGVSIEIRGKLRIHKGVHYRLEGYEAGEFTGYPSWQAPEAQQPFQFRSCFVVSEIIEPKPAEDGALIAPQFDPIEALAKELNSNPLWPNGEAPDISLSSNAAPKEVVTRAVEMWGFDGGHIKTYQILEVRQTRLDAMPGCSAALIESDLGKKILLFRYEQHDKTGLWWTRFYDVPEKPELRASNGSQPFRSETNSTSSAAGSVEENLTKQISGILTECQKIKPGMTRADLLKVFTTEGGLSTQTWRTFVHIRCPYIKVDVEFAPTESKQERPMDSITKITKPYLAWSIID